MDRSQFDRRRDADERVEYQPDDPAMSDQLVLIANALEQIKNALILIAFALIAGVTYDILRGK